MQANERENTRLASGFMLDGREHVQAGFHRSARRATSSLQAMRTPAEATTGAAGRFALAGRR
jgi:hypothetical protein